MAKFEGKQSHFSDFVKQLNTQTKQPDLLAYAQMFMNHSLNLNT